MSSAPKPGRIGEDGGGRGGGEVEGVRAVVEKAAVVLRFLGSAAAAAAAAAAVCVGGFFLEEESDSGSWSFWRLDGLGCVEAVEFVVSFLSHGKVRAMSDV